MKLEHVALLVADPVAIAGWYVEHLGMRVVRKGDAPGHARFLADDAGASVLEVYAGTLPFPDYRLDGPAGAARGVRGRDVEATGGRG